MTLQFFTSTLSPSVYVPVDQRQIRRGWDTALQVLYSAPIW